MKSGKTIQFFRNVALAEGVSFLLLLLVAMPLKYLAGMPAGVTLVGWAHGVLFVAYLLLAVEVRGILGKDFFWLCKAFLASVLPFGTFVLDRSLKRELQAQNGTA